jgi:hypothetical protein
MKENRLMHKWTRQQNLKTYTTVSEQKTVWPEQFKETQPTKPSKLDR